MLDLAGDIDFHSGLEGFRCSRFDYIGFIVNCNPPLVAAQRAVRTTIAGSVGNIESQMDASAAHGVVRTVVEFLTSQVVSRIEVDYV